MTKQSAASLLAQRLRSHTTCLKPDPNFTASKKKTLESRKQNQMCYVLTKPLAQMAIIASLATTSIAHSTKPTDKLQDHLMDNQNFIFLTDFTLMVTMLTNLIWYLCTRVANKPQEPPRTDEDVPTTEEQTGSDNKQNDQNTQTTHVEPETLISLRRQIKQLEAQNTHLQAQLQQIEQRLQDQQTCFQKDFRRQRENYELQAETMRTRYKEEVRVKARNRLRFAINTNIFPTNNGSSWHASQLCASQRTPLCLARYVPTALDKTSTKEDEAAAPS